MSLVIRNDKPKGRFIRYQVNGVSKSVFLSPYQTLEIEEIDGTDHLLNRRDRLINELIQKFENSSSLKDFFYKEKGGVTDITDDITSLFKKIQFTYDGKQVSAFIRLVDSIEVGTSLFEDQLGKQKVSYNELIFIDGDSTLTLTLVDGTISKVIDGGVITYSQYTIVSSDKKIPYNVFIASDESISVAGTTLYKNDSGSALAGVPDGNYTYNDIVLLTVSGDEIVAVN